MSELPARFTDRIFGHPLASIFIIAVAWLNKLLNSIHFYSLSDDKALYVHLALNATEGNGFTETFYFLQDPETAFHFINPTIISPGYSFVLVPLLLVTGKNIILSTLILERL